MDESLREVPDFDDLVFEMRNKDYGAYQLRKRYNSVVIAGIILASFFFRQLIVESGLYRLFFAFRNAPLLMESDFETINFHSSSDGKR